MLDEPLYESPWTANPSEWWVLNPGPFIDICFDVGIERFVFTEKIARFIPNMRLAPERLLEASARGRPWRAIIVEADNKNQGKLGRVAAEYRSSRGFEHPFGVFPIWSAAHDHIEDLEELCEEYNPGRRIGSFFGSEEMSTIAGQEKRILIRSFPVSDLGWSHAFGRVSHLKASFPNVIFHYHGGKSVSRTLGVGVDAFDHPVRLRWSAGFPDLMLPNGAIVNHVNYLDKDQKLWSDFIGRKPRNVYAHRHDRKAMSRSAYEFNLMSLKWLVSNYDRVWHPSIGGLATDQDFDHESPDNEWEPTDDLKKLPAHLKRERYDRWICDACSVAVSCPYARPGAVCVVEDSEAVQLVQQFRSRRAVDIVEGLAQLISLNTERLKRGLAMEIDKEKIDPNVSKLIDSIFDRGVQLAKMRSPELAKQMTAGTKVHIGIATQGGNATVLQAANPAELMAGVAARLAEEGIPIEDATEDDVARVLGAIEAQASG